MPRTTRRSEPSPSPEILIEDEPVPAAINGAVEKVEHAAHSVQHYAHKTYRRIHHYIPHALLHRTKSEYYLMFYNTLTLFLWSYLGILVILHLSTPSPAPPPLLNPSNTATTPSNPEIDGSSHKATAQLGAYLSRILRPLSNISAPKASMTGIHLTPTSTPPTFFAKLSHAWGELLHRGGTTYASRSIGLSALLIQSLAALEPLHAYLHLTRSPLPIAASQIFSRLLVIWYFVESSPTAQSSPWYASMLLAWSSAEVIRSTYYLLSLLRLVPPTHNTARAVAVGVNIITTLRYTAFYLLYPLGAGSEYALLLKGFPSFPTRQSALLRMGQYASLVAGVSNPPEWKVLWVRVGTWVEQWGAGAWSRVPFVVVWPVSLGVLMVYMHQQRVKVLGKGPGRSIPGGRLRDVGGKKRV